MVIEKRDQKNNYGLELEAVVRLWGAGSKPLGCGGNSTVVRVGPAFLNDPLKHPFIPTCLKTPPSLPKL